MLKNCVVSPTVESVPERSNINVAFEIPPAATVLAKRVLIFADETIPKYAA